MSAPTIPTPLTTFDTPPTAGRSRAGKWAEAASFAEFLGTAQTYRELWARPREVPAEFVRRVEAVGGRWHLLALSADWCIDAVDPLTVLARLANLATNLDLRLLDRDQHLDLMDEHLTNGRSRSIPVVILLDGDLTERAWWGPRPGALQVWVAGEGQALEKDERYRRARQWHARDRGHTTLDEIAGMIERAAADR